MSCEYPAASDGGRAVLWCPLAVHQHVLVGHVLPLVVIVLAGAAIGVRMFRLPRA